MLIDGRTVEDGSVIETELCIIGSGAAGLSVAMEFASSRYKVILIESGGLEYDEQTQNLYDGYPSNIDWVTSRKRFFGGSTNCWMGRCRPLDAVDFQKRPWVPNSGWPLTRDNLNHYYQRASSLLNIWPNEEFDTMDWERDLFPGQYFNAFKSADSKILGAPAIHSLESKSRFGPRFSPVLKKSSDIDAYLYSNLVNIQQSQSGNKIEKVQIATFGGNGFDVSAKYFVLALGGIENPRLLLASNKQEPAGVGNRNDLVGRYFMGHPIFPMGDVIYQHEKNCFVKEKIGVPTGALFFRLRDKLQADERIMNSALWLNWNISKGDKGFRYLRKDILEGKFPDSLGKNLLRMLDDFGDVANTMKCNIFGKRSRPASWRLLMQAEQLPEPENRITLVNKTDAMGVNKTAAQRKASELGRRTALRLTEIFASEVTRYGIGRVKIDESALNVRPFRGDAKSNFHFGHDMGTTRMSNSPRDGVVDKDCKVHGLENMYVAGASVFPTSGFANPTMTIIALAIRIADHVKLKLK